MNEYDYSWVALKLVYRWGDWSSYEYEQDNVVLNAAYPEMIPQ